MEREISLKQSAWKINNKSLSVRVSKLEKAHRSKPRVRMLVAMTKVENSKTIKPLTELGWIKSLLFLPIVLRLLMGNRIQHRN